MMKILMLIVMIDIFSIISKLNENFSFEDAYNSTFINSKLSMLDLLDLMIDKNLITPREDITDNGYQFVIKKGWMFFYNNFLYAFNFDDFNYFFKHNNYSLELAGLKFLNKHIDIANKNKEFDRLIDSYEAKGMIYDHIKKYNQSLKYVLNVFILNLNPIYLDDKQITYHIPLDEDNIDTLSNFHDAFSTAKIKKYFNKQWDSIDFETIRIPKKKCWNILKNLFKGRDVEEYCEEIMEKYFS